MDEESKEQSAQGPSRTRGATARLRNTQLVRDYAVVGLMIALIIALSLTTPAFFTARNFLNVLDQNASIGIIACGMTLVIIAGGFDLSVGAIFAVCGVLAAVVAKEVNPFLGLVVGTAAGPLLGIVNGLLIARLQLNSFLTTLASSIAIRGLGIAISGGFLITITDTSFAILGRGTVFSMRYAVIIFVAFVIASAIILHGTKWGRFIYAVGGNEEAARLSGIRVGLIRASTFAFSGFAAGLGGVLATSRVSTGIPSSGVGLELLAIAAVVLGGTSIMGGAGAVWRTMVGVFLLAFINNGFNILNVEPYVREIFTGSIIILAVAINTMTGRK